MRPTRLARAARWMMVVAAAGILPAFVLQCDSAALNIQRGFFQELGALLSQAVAEGTFVTGG